eukprot:CAMPEP_0198213418 /NCGR_PEP_ID=MMETSP1445-20131203/28854_1 /TAXON_ID=36898 /ORGANISM="Pyramimonas sp., Strain CCMP2087" /LENGTH=172 /DNA_ID=CAMNT_0043888055 /DNA_START=368 /DNA_END=882 /DNA_ORIENTATION=+
MKAIAKARQKTKHRNYDQMHERSREEASNASALAKSCWWALHIAAFASLLVLESDLRRWFASGNVLPLLLFGLLVILNFALYFYVLNSNPGYVNSDSVCPPECAQQVREQALNAIAAEPAPPSHVQQDLPSSSTSIDIPLSSPAGVSSATAGAFSATNSGSAELSEIQVEGG